MQKLFKNAHVYSLTRSKNSLVSSFLSVYFGPAKRPRTKYVCSACSWCFVNTPCLHTANSWRNINNSVPAYLWQSTVVQKKKHVIKTKSLNIRRQTTHKSLAYLQNTKIFNRIKAKQRTSLIFESSRYFPNVSKCKF